MMPDNRVDVFISYAHSDQGLREKLEAHLGALKRRGDISVWSDQHIDPGTPSQDAFKSHLQEAHFILLLISPDFLTSEYCTVSMKDALEREKHREAVVIPIILHPCDWKKTALAQLEALPKNHRPITTWKDLDDAFYHVAKELRYLVDNLLVNTWNDQGNEAERGKQYDEALRNFENILHRKPSVAATICTGNVLNDLMRYEEALHLYDRQREASNPEATPFNIQRISANSGDYERKLYAEALQVYEHIFQQSPSSRSPSPWTGLRQDDLPVLTAESGRPILSRLHQAIQHNPVNPFLYHLKGNVFFQLAQYQAALGAYEQAVHLQTDFDLAQQYLSETIMRISQREYQKFDELARQDLAMANRLRDQKPPSSH
jgi:tetratricopeptide (TPR) repeat protein